MYYLTNNPSQGKLERTQRFSTVQPIEIYSISFMFKRALLFLLKKKKASLLFVRLALDYKLIFCLFYILFASPTQFFVSTLSQII